ncbi:MAG: T9SS type A sorting domain-containing protein [bacterium]
MRSKIIVLASVLMLSSLWAVVDPNAVGVQYQDKVPVFHNSGSSEGAVPQRFTKEGDALPGQIENQPLPAVGEPPQVLQITDEGRPSEPKPLWGEDIQVYSGDIRSPTPLGSERMIAYDQTHDGVLFAAFVVANGDTISIYRSTDGGRTWSIWSRIYHTGNVLSSPELVVAEGDSSFVFLFCRTSANNGDIYCARFGLTGGGVVFPVKVDGDTIVNLAACKDNGSPYYLYVTYEYHDGYKNVQLMRSTNYGVTWTAPATFVDNTIVPPKPDIAVGYNNRVYVCFLDKRQSSVDSASFRVKRSTDRGNNWEESRQVGTPRVRVFDGVIGADNTDPSIWLVHVRDMEPFNGKGLGVFYYYTTTDDTVWYYGGDEGIGHGDTDNNEQLPSIATHWSTGSPTVCYAIVPSESLMFTWCSGDTNWTTPIKVNDHRHTGSFAPAAGWKNAGSSSYSAVLYAGVGPQNLWFDSWDNTTAVDEKQPAAVLPVVTVKPNPAAGRAVINWSTVRGGAVELTIHDVTGRQVVVLAQGQLNAGEHRVTWNCADVPAGVYLYRLNGTISETGLIVVSH